MADRKMYFVYILLSERDSRYYTGITDNLERRINQHNAGINRSTKNRGPFKLIFAQECIDRIEARTLEKYFKSGAGRELRDKLLK